MTLYQKSIIAVTKCSEADAVEIEDYMRNVIFHSTLDWQTKAQFNNAARTAWNDILWMRSPEGIAYMNSLTAQYS